MVLWSPIGPSRTTTKKDVLFIIGDWMQKCRKSRDTWSNRQIWPWSKNEAGQRLTEYCQESELVTTNTTTQHKRRLLCSLPTTQEKTLHRDITRWPMPKFVLIIFFAAKGREALYSQEKQDWELTMAQIMNSLLPNSGLNWKSRENH